MGDYRKAFEGSLVLGKTILADQDLAGRVDKTIGVITIDEARGMVDQGVDYLRQFVEKTGNDPRYNGEPRVMALNIYNETAKYNPDLAKAGVALFFAQEADGLVGRTFGLSNNEDPTILLEAQLQEAACRKSAKILLDTALTDK
jgi:hypothetical protein